MSHMYSLGWTSRDSVFFLSLIINCVTAHSRVVGGIAHPDLKQPVTRIVLTQFSVPLLTSCTTVGLETPICRGSRAISIYSSDSASQRTGSESYLLVMWW